MKAYLSVVFSGALIFCASASADFRLPFSGKVAKVIFLPVEAAETFLEKFSPPSDVGLELFIARSGPLDRKLLEKIARRGRISIHLQGEIDPGITGQLYRLRPDQVWYELKGGALSEKTINHLYALGPVLKVLELGGDFAKSLLDKARRVRFSALAFPAELLSEEKLAWLGEEEKIIKVALLSADFDPQLLDRLARLKPLRLVVATAKNRLGAEQYRALVQVRGADITVMLDGRATVQDLEPLAALENLRLVFRLENPPQFIPGLGALLEKIGPPTK
jgi:hypothetical protein